MKIPIISPEAVERIDWYLNTIRPYYPLPKIDHQKWKLLKKAIPILYKSYNSEFTHRPSNEEMLATIAILTIERLGIGDELKGLLIMEGAV